MKKEMNNKGFSLVELIIVIAIMAVLVGLLAPQYLKYVNNSKVSADVANAQSLATAFNVAIADGQSVGNSYTGTGNDATNLPAFLNLTVWPETKLEAGSEWAVTIDDNGVQLITLKTSSGTYECYPNPDDTADGYTAKNKK